MAAAALLAIGAAVLAAVIPGRRATRASMARAMSARGPVAATGSPAAWRLVVPHAFSLMQFSLSVLLTIGASLLLASLYRLETTRSGFTPEGLVNVQVMPPPGGVNAAVIVERALADLQALPGVSRVAATSIPPMTGVYFQRPFRVETRVEGWKTSGLVSVRAVSGDYFRTMQIPLLKGRTFTRDDQPMSPCVVLVSESAARALWPGENPVRARLDLDDSGQRPHFCEVVGVVGDARDRALEEPPQPQIYFSHVQEPSGVLTILVRASGPAEAMQSAILKRALDVVGTPKGALAWTVDSLIASSLREPRFRAACLSVFAATAVLLAALGVYAVTAHTVRLRARDMAIQLALGATHRRVIANALGGTVASIVLGLFISLPLAVALGRVLRSLLFGITPSDPAIMTLVSLVLTGIALLAGYVPSRQIAKLDPREVLRQE